MTTPLPAGPLTPYVTPALLTQAPTGISWSSIPPERSATPAQRLAVQADICSAATALVDACCNQPLRATADILPLYGPGARVQVAAGVQPAKLVLKRWPVLAVTSIRISPNMIPRTWTTVTSGDWEIVNPPAGLYGSAAPGNAGEGGQEILLATRWLDWCRGRDGYTIQVSYVNGWPHAGVTAAAVQGATALQVDDCTGWAVAAQLGEVTGATGVIYETGAQEVIHVTAATTTSGPGTLTLSAPLTYGHAPGVMVSTLPWTVIQAAIWFAGSIALTRGATATTVREIPGGSGSTAGPKSARSLSCEAAAALAVYKRII